MSYSVSIFKRSFSGLVIAFVSTQAFAQDNHRWAFYTNDRFGESICYPADLVRADPPPEDDDGRGFSAKDGAKIATWGSNDSLGSTPEESARQDAKRLTGTTGTTTYKIVRKNFYVVSGRNGDTIFYHRTAFSHGTFSSVEISYPVSDGSVWNEITARVSKCFHPAQGDAITK